MQVSPAQPTPPSHAAPQAHPRSGPGPALDSDTLARTVRAAADGDDRAWATLVGAYSKRVFALARSRCRTEALAEEITQSVFVTVATKLGSGHYAEQGKFEPWLFRVAMNRIRDEMRRQKRHATPTDPSALSDARIAPEQAAGPDDRELAALRDAMQGLNGPDREIVELRHHAGLSFAQISETLGQPMGTVLARHHRALKKLRTMIENHASMKEAG